MIVYDWSLERNGIVKSGNGGLEALKKAYSAADLPGVTPVDWVIDFLLPDVLLNGEAIYTHEGNSDDSWALTVKLSDPL